VQDLYVEKFDPQNPAKYQTPQAGRTQRSSRADQGPKGFASLEFDTVTHDVTVTRHGPIMFEADGKRYALQWTRSIRPRPNPIRLQY
jgi:penicillin amidase